MSDTPIMREIKRSVVAQQMFCTRLPDVVLDVDTAVFALGRDGFPVAALSPAGYALVVEAGGDVALAEFGVTFDTSNLPPTAPGGQVTCLHPADEPCNPTTQED